MHYKCKYNMKFEKHFHLDSLEATCEPNNVFAEPVWRGCVKSKRQKRSSMQDFEICQIY